MVLTADYADDTEIGGARAMSGWCALSFRLRFAGFSSLGGLFGALLGGLVGGFLFRLCGLARHALLNFLQLTRLALVIFARCDCHSALYLGACETFGNHFSEKMKFRAHPFPGEASAFIRGNDDLGRRGPGKSDIGPISVC